MLPLSVFRPAGAALLLGLTACSTAPATEETGHRVTYNDFEAVDGWGPAVPSLTTEKAHSGRFAVKVDNAVEYSLGYANLLGKASTARMRKLTVRGWARREGPDGSATLVVQVTDPAQGNQQLYWEPLHFAEQVKTPGQWEQISKEYTLPAGLQASHELKVYLWRNSAAQPAYLDDLTITAE
ncbi:carbohydrate binding domain-containing protein [Hymenobacter sp. HSC-4F20]|uniref:carbohydrate binding domain-containing protein n=1 Tax=Hymenobacter sp. HSC-4F20 TaxID=2864135 RepID=UPI001C730D92|nr:carbohydrate binding domain-containing protein [Hymenobacter sp. HSC-4F20]MBX0292556.1 carbohydrate binding domain-containing protein [Hymenobacter sp. HSC-4F20]